MNDVQIVIADDDADLLRLLERRLGSAGYTVLACSNGNDAYELVMQRSPVILLADWSMPELTGPELCRRIRASTPGSAVYIIMLTGDEVARLLRVSRDTVYRLAARGELPGRKTGRIWRSTRSAIEDCLSEDACAGSSRDSNGDGRAAYEVALVDAHAAVSASKPNPEVAWEDQSR